MVDYYGKSKHKRYRKNRARPGPGPPKDFDVTISECPTDFMEWLEQGLADGSIVAMGTFDDVPDPFEVS